MTKGVHNSEMTNGNEEPNFSDPEDFVDKISDQELLGDFLKNKPRETDGVSSVIVVDNIPQVGPERLEKLQNVIRKIFNKYGKIQSEHYPLDNDTTKGYMFIEFQNSLEATEAVKDTNGYKLDKSHIFAVNLFSDFDKYINLSDDWVEPKSLPYKLHDGMYNWLFNTNGYDQFNVMFDGGETVGVYLNNPGEPQTIAVRKGWTESQVKWSPRGTYLLTFHIKGVALWGGEKMSQIMKFSHPDVQLIEFSPCERYLITFSPIPDSKEDPQAIIIWDIRSGQKKRCFHSDISSTPWPAFKWSADGNYFARMTTDALSVYETPSFGLLDKKSMKIKGIRDFSWSPVDALISYWTGEERDTPARVTLIELPSRNTLSSKNLFTVADCRMYWQRSGHYLCVKVDRYKSKKEEKDNVKYAGMFHNIYIFRIKEKEIPVDIVELKDTVSCFAWEPVGHRFAVIHGDSPKIGVSFYFVRKGGSVELIKTFEKRQVNNLFWSPNGQFIILAGLRSLNGVLEFIDTGDMTSMQQAEHFMASDVEWDPTGRYATTIVSFWQHSSDNAYWIWNFQGRLLHKQPLNQVCQFMWRPRPPSILTEEQIKDLKKNMKPYNIQFAMEDKKRESKASKEQIERRQEQIQAQEEWLKMGKLRYSENKKRRLDLRNGIDTDELESHTENFTEERVEFLVEVIEIIITDEDE